MRRKVERCPFCGGEGKIWSRVSFDRHEHRSMPRTTVLCDDCGCRTKAFTRPEDAIDAWNSRFDVGDGKPERRRPWFLRILGL